MKYLTAAASFSFLTSAIWCALTSVRSCLTFSPRSSITSLTAAYVKIWLIRHVTICNLSPAKENTIIRPFKGKVLPSHNIRHIGKWEGGCGVLCIFNLATRWKSVVRFTPLPLYLWRKSPCNPHNRRVGGAQNKSGCFRDDKNHFSLPDQMISFSFSL